MHINRMYLRFIDTLTDGQIITLVIHRHIISRNLVYTDKHNVGTR